MSRKFKFGYNMTSITGTLQTNLCPFMIIFNWILLRMRTLSDKTCRENQNSFYSQYLFLNHAIYQIMWKNVWHGQTGHRQYNTVQNIRNMHAR